MSARGKRIGRLYGVGIGPGDPELLTLRAHRILSQVPVVFVPQKNTGSKSYAYSIIKSLVGKSSQKIVALIFPMRKDSLAVQLDYLQSLRDTMEAWVDLKPLVANVQ